MLQIFKNGENMITTHIRKWGNSLARYLGAEGVLAPDPQSWIASPENLLVKLTPSKIMSWHW
jgi:hypothetical protein